MGKKKILDGQTLPLSEMDIVYFCRGGDNEELRYSLRSVAENFPHRSVWLYGEKPAYIKPDHFVKISQERKDQNTKWDRVRAMYRDVCLNNEISEDFVLFNDDFFVLHPVDSLPYFWRSGLAEHICVIEASRDNKPNPYSLRLKKVFNEFYNKGILPKSYELHLPMVFNRHKLLEIIGAYPNLHCSRSLYGNHYNIGGTQTSDVKIFEEGQPFDPKWTFLSTEDKEFELHEVGRFLRERFPKPSPYEVIPEKPEAHFLHMLGH